MNINLIYGSQPFKAFSIFTQCVYSDNLLVFVVRRYRAGLQKQSSVPSDSP